MTRVAHLEPARLTGMNSESATFFRSNTTWWYRGCLWRAAWSRYHQGNSTHIQEGEKRFPNLLEGRRLWWFPKSSFQMQGQSPHQ